MIRWRQWALEKATTQDVSFSESERHFSMRKDARGNFHCLQNTLHFFHCGYYSALPSLETHSGTTRALLLFLKPLSAPPIGSSKCHGLREQIWWELQLSLIPHLITGPLAQRITSVIVKGDCVLMGVDFGFVCACVSGWKLIWQHDMDTL